MSYRTLRWFSSAVITLLFVVPAAATAPPNPVFKYTILDAPLASQEPGRGTVASGVSGREVVGYYQDAALVYHGFLYRGGAYTVLDHPLAGATLGYGTQITGIDNGNVVGFYTARSITQSFIYDGSTWTNLNFPGSNETYARAISGNRVAGQYVNNAGSHAFVFDGVNWTTLKYPGSLNTYALGVDGNTVVGCYSDASRVFHGFSYSEGVYNSLTAPNAVSIPDLGTYANGVSMKNVVGLFQDNSTGHGFHYNGTTWTTLDAPGASGTEAKDIDGHTVVGYYYGAFSRVHGFVVSVPEPTSLLLLAGGIAPLYLRRVRNRPIPALTEQRQQSRR